MEVDKEPTAVIKGKVKQEARGIKNLKIIASLIRVLPQNVQGLPKL